jgi:hypothetical protein
MILRTSICDCLLLSWALPARALPALPPPLRYEGHLIDGEKQVLAVALLFRQSGFRLAALPVLRISYPQFCLALAIVDGQGLPAYYFRRILLPSWLAPAARLISVPPVIPARLDYDRPSRDPEAGPWHWRVHCDAGKISVQAELSSPTPTPLFSNWQRAVEYFLARRRGYYQTPRGFRYLETRLPQVDAWPMQAEVEGAEVLRKHLLLDRGGNGEPPWPDLHSAMLFPQWPLEFERSLAPSLQLPSRVPTPVGSRRSGLEEEPLIHS